MFFVQEAIEVCTENANPKLNREELSLTRKDINKSFQCDGQ